MSYVTTEFYKNTYHGNSIPDAELQSRLDRASMDVDIITHRKIYKLGGFEKLSKFEQLQVQLAVCSQAEYTYTKESMRGISSYSIGDISVGVDAEVFSPSDYGLACMQHLNATRLTYRGL